MCHITESTMWQLVIVIYRKEKEERNTKLWQLLALTYTVRYSVSDQCKWVNVSLDMDRIFPWWKSLSDTKKNINKNSILNGHKTCLAHQRHLLTLLRHTRRWMMNIVCQPASLNDYLVVCLVEKLPRPIFSHILFDVIINYAFFTRNV